MTNNIFDPLVFQPNVFQVGTLDVAPDVATKRRPVSKELRIGVGRAGDAGGGGLGAAPSVRSYTSRTQNEAVSPWWSDPTNFAKPADLTIGDLIVLMIASHGGYPSALPSGFVQLDQSTNAQVYRVTTAVKVADAADVALSNFAVGNSSGVRMGGVVYAVQDAPSVEYSACNQGYIDALVLGTGFTPSKTGDLLLTMTNVSNAYPASVSTANNNPAGWTVDYQWNLYDVIDFRHASYATGDTGAITADFAGSIKNCSGAVVAVGAVQEPPAPAFAISRDSAGILIGVRDNAAPQFAVSRDADGIMLGAWR